MQQPWDQTWNGGHRFQMGGRAPLPLSAGDGPAFSSVLPMIYQLQTTLVKTKHWKQQ